MLPPLDDAVRRRIFRIAVTLCTVPMLLAPLAGRSSFEIRAEHEVFDRRFTPVRLASNAAQEPTVARDPFVPQVSGSARVTTNFEGTAQRTGAVVRAIVSGPAPRALIEEGGRTRIVATGDTLRGARVLRIDENGVFLSDRTVLKLEQSAQ